MTREAVFTDGITDPRLRETLGTIALAMKRVLSCEQMDDPDVNRDDLDASLRFIRRVNRRLGGVSALLRALARWSSQWRQGQTVTLLDVATGSADLPIAARNWALEHGYDLRIVAIDAHPTTLSLARDHVATQDAAVADAIDLVELRAQSLTDRFEPNSFDFAHAGMFLHHLPEIEILTVLRMMHRIARTGVMWNDLMRSRIHATGARALSIRAPSIVKHDAVASVRAGFTKREALDIATRVGIENPRYSSNYFTGRFILVGEK